MDLLTNINVNLAMKLKIVPQKFQKKCVADEINCTKFYLQYLSITIIYLYTIIYTNYTFKNQIIYAIIQKLFTIFTIPIIYIQINYKNNVNEIQFTMPIIQNQFFYTLCQ